MGRSPDPVVEAEINEENALYGDIIQTDYLDTYKNLTLKAISWMSWVDSYCPKVETIVKSDDDMVIDVFKLIKRTKKMSKNR